MEAFAGDGSDKFYIEIKRVEILFPRAKYYIVTFNLARGPVSVENYKI